MTELPTLDTLRNFGYEEDWYEDAEGSPVQIYSYMGHRYKVWYNGFIDEYVVELEKR